GAVRGLGVRGRRGDRAIRPRARRGQLVEPGRQLVPALLDAVLGEGVVEGGGQVVDRPELQRGLRVGALALHAVHRVQHVLRQRIDVAFARRVGGVGRGAGLAQRVAPLRAGVPAAGDATLVVAEVAVLPAAGQGDAEAVVGEGMAEDARHLAGPAIAPDRVRQVAGGSVVHRLDAEVGDVAGFQRTRGLDVDGRADAAGGGRRAAGLVDLHAGDRLRGQVGEVER